MYTTSSTRGAFRHPPPPSGLEACHIQAEDPQSSSAEFCNPLMKLEFRPPAALAGPLLFRSTCLPPFASILCILWCFVSRKSSEFEFWTSPSPDPRNIMRIMPSGSSKSKIWTPLDPDPQYIMQIMLSGTSDFNSGHLQSHPSSYSSSQQSINSIQFKRIDPQYDDF